MEGATDAEAAAIALQTAQACGITAAEPSTALQGLAFADVTGTLTASAAEAAFLLEHPYAQSLGRFGRTVSLRYRALLAELDVSTGDAHGQIVATMISGNLAPLEAWLDARHGPGTFARMFRGPSPGAGPRPVR